MEAMIDLYAVLKVKPSATDEQIKKSFRKLAAKLHPDRHPGDKVAEEEFKRVSAAFSLLSDPAKRKAYDDIRSRQVSSSFSRRAKSVKSPEESPPDGVRSTFVEDLLRAASGKNGKRSCFACRGVRSFGIRLGPVTVRFPCPLCWK